MKKIFLPIIITLIVFFLIYNSKTEYYEKSKEFHNSYFSSEIIKIEQARGTKIYYENDNFFYESDYKGVKLMVNDVIRKSSDGITILRKNSKGKYIEIGKGKSIEPKISYFKYFFDL
ncbi:hypothetical protein ABGT15_13090 [Flavobacterium enshiense]|uniref:hypothetical protein n=1 Tax=Flavobacterium enshiense TaxID=1341165 RepID=UPI00345CC8EC